MLMLPDILKHQGIISAKNDFFNLIKISKQNYYKIKRREPGAQHFTAAQILATCEKLGINANWIMGLEDNIYSDNSVKLKAVGGANGKLKTLKPNLKQSAPVFSKKEDGQK